MQPVFRVSQFIDIVNQNLEQAFSYVRIEGEVSSYGVSQSKWVNFNLKDETADAVVACWGTVWQIKSPLEDGMKVIIEGRPQLRAQSGRFSMKVESVTPTGEGALKRAYELLRIKLEQEGVFARQRELPTYPVKVGLITSNTAQAYKDFMIILKQRWCGVIVEFLPVQVQGSPAPRQIVEAIEYFNQSSKAEVLALVRGGGSLEDLQAFNDEDVVRAVAGSRIPTVVGVGHEGDVTLSDLAADVRAATPTDAAKRVVPDKNSVIDQIGGLARQLTSSVDKELIRREHSLHRYTQAMIAQVEAPRRRLENSTLRLSQAFSQHTQFLATIGKQVDSFSTRLVQSYKQNIAGSHQALLNLIRALNTSNPSLQLRRGYSIIRHNGKIINSARSVEVGSELMLQLAKDRIRSEIKDIKYGN